MRIENHSESTDKLKKETKKLKEELNLLRSKVSKYEKLDKVVISQDLNQLKKRETDFDFLRSYTPRNEYDVIPFASFDASHIYGNTGSLSENPVENPMGQRGVEHTEVIKFAVRTINEDSESKVDPVTPYQLAEGIMRNDRIQGTVYDLYFRSSLPEAFKRVKLVRPFGALQVSGKPETIDTTKQIINVILPLSGRLDKFSEFMQRFVDTGIRWDRRVYLTIVYFGQEGRDRVRSIVNAVVKSENFDSYKIIFTHQDFSRGAALQKGVESWEQGNVLIFFCDVDVYFTPDFLERCRLHTSPGEKVYYPIVFSQYNPIITYGGEQIPSLDQQMKLSKDSGFWRDFGFGMSCQYRDDFLKVGGFDLTIKGWGMEDVKLYRNYLYSKLTVIRGYDRGIFHIYHRKECNKNLADSQFISCLQSKAINEGSHKQMGMLAFGNYLLGKNDPDWKKKLEEALAGAEPEIPKVNQGIDVSKTESKKHDDKNMKPLQQGKDSSLLTLNKPVIANSIINVDSILLVADTLLTSAHELHQISEGLQEVKSDKQIVDERFTKYLQNLQEFQQTLVSKSQLLFKKAEQMKA